MFTAIGSNIPGELRSSLANLSAAGKSRNLETSIAVAYTVCRNATIPPCEMSSVGAATEFYHQNVRSNVLGTVDFINECLLIDTTTVRELVAAFYKIRVRNAYPPAHVIVSKECGAMDLFGISQSLPKNVLECIENNAEFIGTYITQFQRLLDSRIKD